MVVLLLLYAKPTACGRMTLSRVKMSLFCQSHHVASKASLLIHQKRIPTLLKDRKNNMAAPKSSPPGCELSHSQITANERPHPHGRRQRLSSPGRTTHGLYYLMLQRQHKLFDYQEGSSATFHPRDGSHKVLPISVHELHPWTSADFQILMTLAQLRPDGPHQDSGDHRMLRTGTSRAI